MKAAFTSEHFTLFQGDCLRIMAALPEESVDMIFADPPYNLSNGGFTCMSGKRESVNKGDWDVSRGAAQDFKFHKKWILACKKIMKKDASIWISGTYHSIYSCGYALTLCGFKILNDIAWFKPNAAPNISCRYFTASHETLLWAKKDEKATHTFNYHCMKDGDWPQDPIKKPGKQMRSLWWIPTAPKSEKKFGKHPTQKPLALLKRIIMASTKENDLILDPFSGSSTTGIAAVSLGRKFIGIEKEKEYIDLSTQRYQDLKI